MTVITRFAPSPTGFLHIGGARTALFNWLFARHHQGKFLLRIEDTDHARSTQEAIDAILDGMRWMGLAWDGEPVYQSTRAARHVEIAETLLANGHAYHCYATPEELQAMREEAAAGKKPFRYDGRWRDRDPAEAPAGVAPVIRLKAPRQGELTIDDQVQGKVTVAADQLDDMILLRSDGTPTYMHAVVVDDHDMNVTHIIRGDDHLTNAFRQRILYEAMGWEIPVFAHIPLIHGSDGAKLSKRHGALGVEAYRDMGYLPETLRNYLLRLGWAHGDEEIIPTEKAIEWFSLEGIGKSPSRFDTAKLDHLNGHYIREADDDMLAGLIQPKIEAILGLTLSPAQKSLLERAMSGLKQRTKNINELADNAAFYFHPLPLPLTEKAQSLLGGEAITMLGRMLPLLEDTDNWTQQALEELARSFSERESTKLGNVAQPLRAALTGSHISPSVFEVMELLGKEESLRRIRSISPDIAGSQRTSSG